MNLSTGHPRCNVQLLWYHRAIKGGFCSPRSRKLGKSRKKPMNCRRLLKLASVEETLMFELSPYSKFEFLFPVTLSLPLTCPTQFLSHTSVFVVRNSVAFLTKTKTKAWLSVLWWENSNLLYCESFFEFSGQKVD